MQTGLIELYLTEILQTWLQELSLKFPMSPLNAILSNYLNFPEDGTETSRLHLASHKIYEQIKWLETLPDDLAFEPEKEFVMPESVEPTELEVPTEYIDNRMDVA